MEFQTKSHGRCGFLLIKRRRVFVLFVLHFDTKWFVRGDFSENLISSHLDNMYAVKAFQ